MDERISDRRELLAGRIKASKMILLSASVLSLLNCILTLIGSSVRSPLYLDIPYFLAEVGKKMLTAAPKRVYAAVPILIAAILLLAGLAFCCLKRGGSVLRFVITDALIVADLAFGIALFAAGGDSDGKKIFGSLLDLAFHIAMIIFSESGRRSSYALTVLPTDEDIKKSDELDPYEELKK